MELLLGRSLVLCFEILDLSERRSLFVDSLSNILSLRGEREVDIIIFTKRLCFLLGFITKTKPSIITISNDAPEIVPHKHFQSSS